jgi:UDP-N-acetylmuramoyl-tripeptide--D-alanyl-D-alanine ligase
MIQATLNQVGHAVNAITHNDLMFNGVSIDSRNIEAGNLFIAIKGAQFDGHQYINKAIKQGAVAIVADHEIDDCSVPVLVVYDTREALGKIAKYWRASNN